MTHLALASRSPIPAGDQRESSGRNTMSRLYDLLASADFTGVIDETLDQIDEIVPPGPTIGTLDHATATCPAEVEPACPFRL